MPKRHHGLVCSAQAWMQGMAELYSETWQLGLLAHCGLLAPDSPAAGQKLSIQLIQQQILKKSFNSLGWEGDCTADLPLGSLPAHHSHSERTLSAGPLCWLRAAKRCLGVPGHGCSDVCHKAGIHRSPKIGTSCTWQPAAELVPVAAWLCVWCWGCQERHERGMKDGEQSRPSPGRERPAVCGDTLSEPSCTDHAASDASDVSYSEELQV